MNFCASAVTLSSFVKEKNLWMSIVSGVFLFVATSWCCLLPSPTTSLASYIGVLGNISDSFYIKLSLSKLSLSMFFSFHVSVLFQF